MRVYANLINQNLALLDLPKIKYDQIKIFKQLLVYDHLPDDDFEKVLNEAGTTSLMPDPSFSIFFQNDFEEYIEQNRHHAKWQKIKKDYNYYIEWEIKRRNKHNPYFSMKPGLVSSWDSLPDFTKKKSNLPYQFDQLYREAETLAGEVYELTHDYKESKDKDLFRAKVNSILVPNKIVFALNATDNIQDLTQSEIAVVDIKLTLDAYKTASIFLKRLIDSLNKIKWNYPQALAVIESSLGLAKNIEQTIQRRIFNFEKNFILYIEAEFGEE
ncbi:MAG: hypothetical protein NVSMB66_1130 [Candidatus Doudnabacteria bacterium]